jgi:Undecaprenyl-phosphate galactose phosphotransferase WbaP
MSSVQLEGKTMSLKKRLFDFFSNSGRCRVVALAATDALCLLIIGGSLVWIYYLLGFAQYKFSIYWRLWPIFPLYIVLNAVCRLYHGNWMYPAMPLSPVEEFRRLLACSVFSHLLLMSFLGFTRHNLEYSRLIIGMSGILTGLFSQSFRNLIRLLMFKVGIFQIPVILVGDGVVAKRVQSILRCNSYFGLKIKAKLGEHELREVLPLAKKLDVKIMLACQNERLFRAQIRDFATWFNYIEYLPRVEIFPVFGAHAVAIGQVGGLEMVNQLRMKALRWEKDLLDAIASAILFILALPIMILISFLVKLTSKGPILYKAKRLGKNGKEIKVYKFRSMYVDAGQRLEKIFIEKPELKLEYEANFKLKNDPRITPLGKLLRKTSLDELPQFINVFKREMALVGPRPIVKDEIKHYGENYSVFSSVRPGITGLWQCSGRSDTSYEERVAFDVYYVLNWSPWMDIWILIRTFFSVLTLKGAC